MADFSGGSRALLSGIRRVLDNHTSCEGFLSQDAGDTLSASSVLLLVGQRRSDNGGAPEPGLILNKRSREVRQPGDLCCPGGGVSPALDPYLARLVTLPGFPLSRWPRWTEWRRSHPDESRLLALLFATGLRESVEEMRLNPWGVHFLGCLPPHCLSLYRRVIYPMVAWIGGQNRFTPNWEVERVVFVPLRHLLDHGFYARYRLHTAPHLRPKLKRTTEDFACFIFEDGNGTELLWGVTYRIVTLFLKLVFGFRPPELRTLPVVHGILDEIYLNAGR
jgi:hypothetical protein